MINYLIIVIIVKINNPVKKKIKNLTIKITKLKITRMGIQKFVKYI